MNDIRCVNSPGELIDDGGKEKACWYVTLISVSPSLRLPVDISWTATQDSNSVQLLGMDSLHGRCYFIEG